MSREHAETCDCVRCQPDRCDYCGQVLNDAGECCNDGCEINIEVCGKCDGTGAQNIDTDHFSPARGHWTTASRDFCDCPKGNELREEVREPE